MRQSRDEGGEPGESWTARPIALKSLQARGGYRRRTHPKSNTKTWGLSCPTPSIGITLVPPSRLRQSSRISRHLNPTEDSMFNVVEDHSFRSLPERRAA